MHTASAWAIMTNGQLSFWLSLWHIPSQSCFDPPTPPAWDGDKIDYVPIPVPQSGFAQSAPLQLTSDEVVSLIHNFLSSKGFALPGLFLRIYSRDVMTEYDFVLHLPFGKWCAFELYQNHAVDPIDSRLHLSRLNTCSADTLLFPNLPNHLHCLCWVSVVSMLVCIHPNVWSSHVGVFSFKTSFTPRQAIKMAPLSFCTLSNVWWKQGRQPQA